MDNGSLAENLSRNKLSESDMPGFIYLFTYGDPAKFSTYKNFLKNHSEPLKSWAAGDSRRRAFDRAYESDGVDGLFDYVAKHGPQPDRTELETPLGSKNAFWCQWEREAADYREEFPEANLNVFNEFVLSKATNDFNDLEAVMWCAVACLEGALTMEGVPPLRLKDKFFGDMVPVEFWVPAANEAGLLSTSRYRVINHLLQNYMHSKQDRATQHLRGGPRWRKPEGSPKLRALDRSGVKLALSDGWYRTDSLDLFLDVQLHFVDIFEWFQLSLFKDGVSAAEIVNEFSKFPQIHRDFYHDLAYFYKRKTSRRLYNHHV